MMLECINNLVMKREPDKKSLDHHGQHQLVIYTDKMSLLDLKVHESGGNYLLQNHDFSHFDQNIENILSF